MTNNCFSYAICKRFLFFKVRLTFKLQQDEVWISTKERTEKIQMKSIKSVISEPVTNREEYHVMGFGLGTTENSRSVKI